MEENNTEYIETEPGTDMEENTDSGTDTGEETETEESGDNAYDASDDTGSNANDDTASGTETDTVVSSGTSSDDNESPDVDDDGEINDGDLLESLDALIKALSSDAESDTGETEDTGTDESQTEAEISEYDSQTLETLQGIQSTLAAIQAENELWHTETLKYREETRETQESVIVHLEYASLLLIAIGFFVAFLCGGKFADIFFKRMKGDGRNE